jgi:hypothetical protein
MEERELPCPQCGYFIVSTSAPWGRIKAYCRRCKKWRFVLLGKPPMQDVLTQSAA